jgi:hypothetical protein
VAIGHDGSVYAAATGPAYTGGRFENDTYPEADLTSKHLTHADGVSNACVPRVSCLASGGAEALSEFL